MKIFRNTCARCGHVGKYDAEAHDAYVMCDQCGNITNLDGIGLVVEEE